jgi:hypothetical protein
MVRNSFLGLAASLVFSVTAVMAQDASQEKPKPGSVEFLDAVNGFRGVKFGTEQAKFPGLVLSDDQGSLKLYTKKDDDLLIGPAKLTGVIYEFFEGKFFGAVLTTGTKSETSELMALAVAAFGEGEQIDPDNTVWEGKTAFAHFSENPATGEGTLTLGHRELAKKTMDYEQKMIEEGVSEL